MDNAYKPPESNLKLDTENINEPHYLWKIFFWVYAPLTLISVILLLFIENLSIFDYLDMVIYTIAALGLFGYSFSKALFTQKIWGMFFYLFILWFIFYEVIAPFVLNIPQYGEPAVLDIWLLVYILEIPIIACLYLYGFKVKQLWTPKNV